MLYYLIVSNRNLRLMYIKMLEVKATMQNEYQLDGMRIIILRNQFDLI